MKNMFTKAAVFSLAFTTTAAFGGGATGGALEVTQLMNNAQLVQQYTEMVEQTATQAQNLQQQINTYKNLVHNTRRLSDLEWGTASTQLMQLRDLIGQLNGMGYSLGAIDDLFQEQYPGFSSISISNSPDHETFSERYQQWNRTTTDTIQTSLRQAGLQESQFDTENATMRTLENMGQSADGQMKALEVGNLIAAQSVRQTQKLRQLVTSNMRMRGAYMAQQVQDDARRQEVRQTYTNQRHPTYVGDEEPAGLPTR